MSDYSRPDDGSAADLRIFEIRDRSLMYIPLPSEFYVVTAIGDSTPSKNRYGYYETEKIALVGYKLTDRIIPVVEGDHIPGRLNRTYSLQYVNGLGVCIAVVDHSFGRGLVRLLLGWSLIVTVPDVLANTFEEALRKKKTSGGYVRSRLYTVASTAFNIENDDDMEMAIQFKLAHDHVEIKRSKLPISSGDRRDYLIEDVRPYTK